MMTIHTRAGHVVDGGMLPLMSDRFLLSPMNE